MPFNPRGYYDDEFYMSFYQSSMRNPVYMASYIYLGARNAEIENLKKIRDNMELDEATRKDAGDGIMPIRLHIEALKRHKRNLVSHTKEYFATLDIDPETIKPDLKDFPRMADILPQFRFLIFVREKDPARYELKYDYNSDSQNVLYFTYNRFPQIIKGCNDSPIKENAMFNLISPCRVVNAKRYIKRYNNMELENVIIALVGLSIDDQTQEDVNKLQKQMEALSLSGFQCS